MNAVLTEFHAVRPRYELPQEHLLEWLARYHARARGESAHDDRITRKKSLFDRYGCGPHRIARRGSDISDFKTFDMETSELYRATDDADIGTRRTAAYERISLEHVTKMYEGITSPPDHLLHVTCTGYSSPSAAQRLVSFKGWSGQTAVTHLYHMGCYAAFPAIRVGAQLAQTARQVDVVHTELCSLQLNMSTLSPEQAVIQSLFGDGSIHYSVTQKSPATQSGLEIISIKEYLAPNTERHMSWRIESEGLAMTLSREVPEVLKANVPRIVESLRSENLVSSEPIFAIHPGGPRIIDVLANSLSLRAEQYRHSIDVLRDYGNMSSATLPHIWQRIVADGSIKSGSEIISLAFGPGLTIFAGLFRKI
jgi:predicted naringenin-chalcone synthase